MSTSGHKYLVSPAGYDNIGAVLGQMGEGFAYGAISWMELQAGGIPRTCEALFINCAAQSQSWPEGKAIRQFVERGGALYVSDWAGGVVQSAFPDLLRFESRGEVEEIPCTVVDPGLAETIGPRLKVHFDAPGWWQIVGSATPVRQHVIGEGCSGAEGPLPIVVSFTVGRGHVIYTSFHNSAQVSQAEQKLLRFLVLRPVLARAASAACAFSQARQFIPGKEVIDTVNRGGRAGPYVYRATGQEGLLEVLQWEGAGQLQLTVRDPSGRIVCQQAQGHPPLQFEVPTAQAGEWVSEVEGADVPFDNFPFVLTLATRPATQGPVVPARKARPRLWTGSGAYQQAWNSLRPGCLIVLLDQSESMAEPFGSGQFGEGRRKCDVLATVLNNLLNEFLRTNLQGAQVRPRAEVAVLGYQGAGARSVWGGGLAGREFVRLPELLEHPLRVEQRIHKEVDEETGRLVEVPVAFPVWVEPTVGSATPMCAALREVVSLAERWCAGHPEHYPPVVVNVTDGAPTDGDPREVARELVEVGTRDGPVLLFSCYLTTRAAGTVMYPVRAEEVPAGEGGLGRLLFELSSVIPETARRNIAGSMGLVLAEGARGLILNGDAASLRQMFTFATIAAGRRPDPAR